MLATECRDTDAEQFRGLLNVENALQPETVGERFTDETFHILALVSRLHEPPYESKSDR
jgi:hypothetical protein